jgi:hypothetical protein
MIDDEIRSALKVDPSPEFVARVRARVASEPELSAWRWSWTVASVAALAAGVAIAFVISRPTPLGSSTVGEAQTAIAGLKPGATFEASGAAPQRRVAQPFRAAIEDATPKPAVVADASNATEDVLIDPREQLALRQLIAGVRAGRVDLSAAQNSTTTRPADLEPVTDIVIAPLTIEPLAPLSGAEGARQ